MAATIVSDSGLHLRVRDDREAKDLSRAAKLLNAKHVAAARTIFARYHSVQARIGLAFADCSKDGIHGILQAKQEAGHL